MFKFNSDYIEDYTQRAKLTLKPVSRKKVVSQVGSIICCISTKIGGGMKFTADEGQPKLDSTFCVWGGGEVRGEKYGVLRTIYFIG